MVTKKVAAAPEKPAAYVMPSLREGFIHVGSNVANLNLLARITVFIKKGGKSLGIKCYFSGADSFTVYDDDAEKILGQLGITLADAAKRAFNPNEWQQKKKQEGQKDWENRRVDKRPGDPPW